MRVFALSFALVAASACATIPDVNYDGASDSGASPPGADASGSDGAIADSAKPDAPITADASPIDSGEIDAAHDVNVVDAPPDVNAPVDAAPDAACALVRSSGSATCDSCLKASCCALGNKCLANDECLAIVTCSRDCASSAMPVVCRTTCRNAHPNGKTDFQDVAACVNTACGASSCAS